MKSTCILILSFLIFSSVTMAQSGSGKAAKFGNSTIDKYVGSVADLLQKRSGLSTQLADLEQKIASAKKGSSPKDIKDLQKKADALESAYKALGSDATKIGKNSAAATSATSKCGLKLSDCLEGVKSATESLSKLSAGIVPELKRIAEAKLKVKALKA